MKAPRSPAQRCASFAVACFLAVALHGCGHHSDAGGGAHDASGGDHGAGDGAHKHIHGNVNLMLDVLRGQYGTAEVSAAAQPTADASTELQTSLSVAFSAEDAIENLADSFGVDVSGQRGVFSASADFQRMRRDMSSSSFVQSEGEMYAMIVHKVSLISPELMLSISPGISDAIKLLPKSVVGTAFNDFFNQHGTHYLSKVYLGGKMHLRFQAKIRRDELTDEFKGSFKLGAQATFFEMAGIGSSVQCTAEDKRNFASRSSYSRQDLQTVGGDPTKTSWNDWKDTVGNMLAPIKQEYTSLHYLVQAVGALEGWTADEVAQREQAMLDGLAQFLETCPDACSGHGLCDVAKRTCQCDEGFEGSTCSARVCPQDCGDGGYCDTEKGVCECTPGWGHEEPEDPTSPCSQDCQPKVYEGDFECGTQRLLLNPKYGTTGWPSTIATCLAPCQENRWGCACGEPAATQYCQYAMNDPGASSTGYTVGDPACANHLLGCEVTHPWSMQGWDLGTPVCPPAPFGRPQVFASITCSPSCAQASGPPLTLVGLHRNDTTKMFLGQSNNTILI